MGRLSKKNNGGRYMDRTCDPYDVNVAASIEINALSEKRAPNRPVSFALFSTMAGQTWGGT